MRILFCFLVLIVTSLPAVAAKWTEYKTPNFVIYSTAGKTKSVQLIQNLEIFHQHLLDITGVETIPADVPLTIYLVGRHLTYVSLTDSKSTAGRYQNTHDGPFAIALAERKRWEFGNDPCETIYHEYVHYFMYQHSQAWFPTWYSEGFADYLSSFVVDRNIVKFGLEVKMRLPVLSGKKIWVPFHEIMETNIREAKGVRRQVSKQLFYAQSWLLTHFLHHQNGFYQKLNDFLVEIGQGANSVEALDRIFEISPEKLDKLVRDYWNKGRLEYVDYKIATNNLVIPTARKLNKQEKLAIDANVIRLFNHKKSGEKKLLKLVKKSSGSDDVRTALAFYYASKKKWEKSLQALGDVTHIKDRSLAVNRAFALILLYRDTESMSRPPQVKEAVMNDIRRILIRAVNTHPNDAQGRFAYSFSYMNPNLIRDLPAKKKKALQNNMEIAYYLAPQRRDIAYWYAVLLKNFDEDNEACLVMKKLVRQTDLSVRQINHNKRAIGMKKDEDFQC